MKAALLKDYQQPLAIEELSTPELQADEVLLRVEACGVCHSDLHVANGEWPHLKPLITLPRILGHEVVGRVVDRGAAVQDVQNGERVGVPWVHWSCGECETCLNGFENLCRTQLITGVSVNGGYAELMKAKASHVARVPDNLSPAEAAPLFCAGVTVYRAIKIAGVRPGHSVAIVGVGGLGHLAVQIAKRFGAEVIAIDVAEDKLLLAGNLGADHVSNVTTEQTVKRVRSMGGVHFAIVTAGSKAAYDLAPGLLKPTGTIVVVGLPAEPLTVSALTLSGRELRIIASSVGTREDLQETLDMAGGGGLRCLIEERDLAEVNTVLDQMKRSQITGRAVLRF